MIRRPPRSTRTDTLFPYTTLFRARPLGAVLFGFLGDRLGRKYTFLITVTLMGIATAGVGMTPSADAIGIAAPIIVIGLRILPGLALGGDYGGAALHRSEARRVGKEGVSTCRSRWSPSP